MLGAVAGDVIGSVYEFDNTRRCDFELFAPGSNFTDDTVLTMAVADCFLSGADYASRLKSYARAYPGRGYGGGFQNWVRQTSLEPYNSFGNGSAMRVSPVGFALEEESAVLREARRSAEATHNHPQGVKGAQAVALAIFLARTKKDKALIKAEITRRFGYDLDRTLDEIRPDYRFDETCQGSVPEAIIAFLESSGFEDAIRKAVSLGGDSDTIACMTGGMAEAFYGGVPEGIARQAMTRLPLEFQKLIQDFRQKFVRGAG